MMSEMDKLRNSLYEDFKPRISMLKELNIDADIQETPIFPLVATKKVTQMRVTPRILPDSQPEILPLDQVDNGSIAVDLPPAGPLVKPVPEIGDVVFVMKHPLLSWVKAKVSRR